MFKGTRTDSCIGLSATASGPPGCLPGKASSKTKRCGRSSLTCGTYRQRAVWAFPRYSKRKARSIRLRSTLINTNTLVKSRRNDRRRPVVGQIDPLWYISVPRFIAVKRRIEEYQRLAIPHGGTDEET